MMDRYIEQAALLWCLHEAGHIVMEPELCKAVAAAIRKATP